MKKDVGLSLFGHKGKKPCKSPEDADSNLISI